jgi:thiamine-phosphate pyrophosphorylase
MAKPAEAKRPFPRLYLATPIVEDAAVFRAELGRALAEVDSAAVLLRLYASDERTLINRVKAIAEVVQPTGAALVVDGYPDIVARAGADGAHLTGIDAFIAASHTLKPARIAGCGGLHTRHDAMLAAERGADYVMFGEPENSGQRPSFGAIIERVEWWAEVFEIPCVAYAAALDEIAPLAEAGTDFVAIGDWIWNDPHGSAAALAAASRLAVQEPVA